MRGEAAAARTTTTTGTSTRRPRAGPSLQRAPPAAAEAGRRQPLLAPTAALGLLGRLLRLPPRPVTAAALAPRWALQLLQACACTGCSPPSRRALWQRRCLTRTMTLRLPLQQPAVGGPRDGKGSAEGSIQAAAAPGRIRRLPSIPPAGVQPVGGLRRHITSPGLRGTPAPAAASPRLLRASSRPTTSRSSSSSTSSGRGGRTPPAGTATPTPTGPPLLRSTTRAGRAPPRPSPTPRTSTSASPRTMTRRRATGAGRRGAARPR